MDHGQSKWQSWDYWHPTLVNLQKTHKTTPTLIQWVKINCWQILTAMWGGSTIIHSENTHASVFFQSLFLSLLGWCRRTAIPFFKSPVYIPKCLRCPSEMVFSCQKKKKGGKKQHIQQEYQIQPSNLAF